MQVRLKSEVTERERLEKQLLNNLSYREVRSELGQLSWE